MIPSAQYPEYRLTLVWRADADGRGVRAYLARHEPNCELVELQSSFHQTLNLQEALDKAMTNFFEVAFVKA